MHPSGLNQWAKFHQTLVEDVVEGADEFIIMILRVEGQGHSEVRHLSELLLRAEAYTLTLGH